MRGILQEDAVKAESKPGQAEQAAVEARHSRGLDKGLTGLVQSQPCQLAAGHPHQR